MIPEEGSLTVPIIEAVVGSQGVDNLN